MAKIKRYKNFSSLKLDASTSNSNAVKSRESHAAMQKFLSGLQRKLVKKKILPDEQPSGK